MLARKLCAVAVKKIEQDRNPTLVRHDDIYPLIKTQMVVVLNSYEKIHIITQVRLLLLTFQKEVC